MSSSIRAFRRSAREWLPAWRQVRSAFHGYRRISRDAPDPERFYRLDRYIKEVERSYAALDSASWLFRQRERYRNDVRLFSSAVRQRCPQADCNETRALLMTMDSALQRFACRLYPD